MGHYYSYELEEVVVGTIILVDFLGATVLEDGGTTKQEGRQRTLGEPMHHETCTAVCFHYVIVALWHLIIPSITGIDMHGAK